MPWHRRYTHTLLAVLLAASLPMHGSAMEPERLRDQATRFEHGLGVERNYAHAYALYCIATRQGDSEAAYHLGWMRLNGRGMRASDALAIGWFRLAAARGDPQSQHVLEDLLTQGHPEQDDDCPLSSTQPGPATIADWVRALAPGYGLDAGLILALIEVESRFDTRAHSAKNARGLMQLLPSTARRFGVEDIWDPAQNLMGGMAYLRWLLDRYEGDLDRSLAAYNAGEHAVERHDGIPPYRETRNYVKRIKHLYTNNSPT
ncbi:MAG: transglycosylase SLT domain-containing protein [Gammaproteobacteria bacterium]